MRGKFELDLLRDDNGDAIVVTGATVSVTVEGTGVAAALYDDITGPAGPGNPFTVTGSTIEFFADQENRYRIDITTTAGFSRTLRYRDVTIDVQDVLDYADTAVATHSAETDNVHGVPSGDSIETVLGAQAKADAVSSALNNHENATDPHPNQVISFDNVEYPDALRIGSPIHMDTLTEWATHAFSAGVTDGCIVLDNGDGTIDIGAGYAALRGSADAHTPLYVVEVSTQAGITLTDQSENYVYLDYNAGSPTWQVSTSRSAFNCLDKCIGYYIYRDGNDLNIIDAREQNVDGNRKARRLFLKFRKFIHAEEGTALGSDGLALTVTSGSFFYMLEELPHPNFDTSVVGAANENVFTLWYRDGVGGWTSVADEKAIDTAVYDNNTGTPAALTASRYGVSWVYIVHDAPSSLHVVMGQVNVTSQAEAESQSPPSSLPGLLGAHASLIGFVVYEKNNTVFDNVLSVFTQTFTSSAATTHNGLSGLQGGAIDEYFHLTSTQYTAYGYHLRLRNTTAPNATVPVHSLKVNGVDDNIDAAFTPKGTGAILAQVPDGTTAGGNKRGDYAVDLQTIRSAPEDVASGEYSVVVGGVGNSATSTRAVVVGGGGNDATGPYSGILGGGGNEASGNRSFVGGGNINTASGEEAAVCAGEVNTSSGQNSFVGGGSNNTSDGSYSYIVGGYYGTTRGMYGRQSHASGQFSITGDAQTGRAILRIETTDATPSILTANGGASPVAATVPSLPDNHAYAITSRVIGRDTSTGDVYHVVAEGTVKRGAGAGTTALDGTPVYTTISKSAGASTWAVALVANTTRGSAEIQVTGAAATTIHWVAKFETVEVG